METFGVKWDFHPTIFVNTIDGKRYEMKLIHNLDEVGAFKVYLQNIITPTPSKKQLRLLFGETVLDDDDATLNEYNICDGSELTVVLLPPEIARSRSHSRSRSRSHSRSRSSSRSHSPSRPLRHVRPWHVVACREV